MTPRLLVPQALLPGAAIDLDADQVHYLSQVLRLPVGAALQVFDGRGNRHQALITELRKRAGTLSIGDALPGLRTGSPRITLIQGIATAEKMDWAIEKATELGVARIVPLQAQRGKVRLDAERAARRHEHWQRLIAAACMQCGRDELVELAPACGWAELGRWVAAGSERLLLAPAVDGSPSQGLAQWARQHAGVSSIALLVGPESGWSTDEHQAAVDDGFTPISLGPRILRTETAGLAAIAALQALLGDL